MSGPGRRFDLAELSNDAAALTEAEIVAATAIARDLEAIAERDDAPTAGFSDKVMATIAAEPTPKPTRVFGAALRARRFGTAVRRGRGRVASGVRWRPAVRGSRSGARTGARRPDRRARPGWWGGCWSRATAECGCRPIAVTGAQRPASVAFAGAQPRAVTVAVAIGNAQSVAHGDRRADRHGRTDGDR